MKKRTKKTLAVSGKVLLRVVLATVLCAILHLSMMFIATGIFSDVVGYQIHEEKDNGEIVLVDNHIYKGGEKHLTKSDVADNQVLTEIREVPPKTLVVFNVLSQIMLLVLLAIFPYQILWEFGNRDDTNVRYKGQRPDPIRGCRIGAIVAIPYAILWVLLVVAKIGFIPDGYMQIYRLATMPFFPFVQWVTTNGDLQATALWQLLLLLPILLYFPAVCGVAYRLGHKQFSIHEHLVFGKKSDKADGEDI